MCAAAATRRYHGKKCDPEAFWKLFPAKLIEIGCEVIEFDDAVRVVGKTIPETYRY